MVNKKFSSKEAIKFGWETLKENLGFFLVTVFIILIISIIPSIAKEIYKKTDSDSIKIITGSVDLLFQIIGVLISLGFIKISLELFDKKGVKVSDLFSQYDLFFKYLGATILYSLIVIGGLILFIVPGIIWGIKFRFFGYFIVEGSGIIESFEKSSQITEGYKWDLFIFNLVLFLISLAGILVFFVGVLITIPVTSMATVFVYKKLQEKTNISETLVK